MSVSMGLLLRRAVLGVLLALLVWSLGDSWRLARHGLALLRLDLPARGALAADPLRNPLVRAGRTRLRQKLRDRDETPEGTPFIAGAWRWCYEGQRHLPADARIYLNTPSPALYYYGNFFWHPARLEVSPESPLIAGEADLAARAWHVPSEQVDRLADFGYTHVIDRDGSGRLTVRHLATGSGKP